MSPVIPGPPAFLATARGGHSADPAARCPFCGLPAGLHQGVPVVSSAVFPMRLVICDTVVEVPAAPPRPALDAIGLDVARAPLPAARAPELTRCFTCDGRRWLGDGYRQPCGNCNPRGET